MGIKNFPKTLFLILFTLFFAFTPSSAKAISTEKLAETSSNYLIFINHVRGPECCDVGSLEHFKLQLETFAKEKTPAFFALRYDAMTAPAFQTLIQQYKNNSNIEFGVMLEVTPQLAKDAFVEYKGSKESWYQAQHAFLIGYSPEDRILLAEQIFAQYHHLFDKYPQLSTAWQTDTPTLNYLQQNYGLKAHQIAREQWGLDSYTLDGGPPHYPYPASRNWIFNPDFTRVEPSPVSAGPPPSKLLIIRHTIDDSLYTYGDDSSAFTSQPNDYSLDDKNFDYFVKLLDQVLNQPHQTGFANLGLENSMAMPHQEEYLRQIERVSKLQQEGKVQVTTNIDQLANTFTSKTITIHQGKDLISNQNNHAYWVTTPNYRVRIRFQNNQVFISDLRTFDLELQDPYQDMTATNQGYLITPYLINDGLSFPGVSKPSFWQKILGIPMINSFGALPKKDVEIYQNYLSLPNITDLSSIALNPNTHQLSYQSDSGEITFDFQETNFDIEGVPDHNQIQLTQNLPEQHPLTFKKTKNGGEISWEMANNSDTNPKKQNLTQTTWSCSQQTCHFEFENNPQNFTQAQTTQYPFIFPEKKNRPLDADKTITYIHNQFAIAGRNPVRIVLVPQDQNGFPTATQEKAQINTTPKADFIRQEETNSGHEYELLDISHNSPAKIKLDLTLDSIDLPTQNIYFAPNCKQNLGYCLTHPTQASWYIRTMIEDKIRLKLLGEQQN